MKFLPLFRARADFLKQSVDLTGDHLSPADVARLATVTAAPEGGAMHNAKIRNAADRHTLVARPGPAVICLHCTGHPEIFEARTAPWPGPS